LCAVLSGFRPVKVLESIGFLERAMGIEPTSEARRLISNFSNVRFWGAHFARSYAL